MDRATAEKLMAIYKWVEDPLNEAAAVIEPIPDHEEQRRLRRPLGEMMASVWLEL